MEEQKKHAKSSTYTDNKKFGKEAVFFVLVMALAFYTVLKGQNLSEIWKAIRGMSGYYLVIAAALGIFFVSAEGYMIWYLLKSYGGKSRLSRCVGYSFIGFFYSGITPSATGGQPMQLYYMSKDGNKGAVSTVVLMVVAAMYKFVLVIVGLGIWLFWKPHLKAQFGNYYWLFLLGVLLNTVLVILIIIVMLFPKWMIHVSKLALVQLEKMHLVKDVDTKMEKVTEFVANYRQTVTFLKASPGKLGVVFVVTVLQRCSVFFITYLIYRGFGFHDASMQTVVLLQASIYVAVDMLPLPGAQGITEIVFRKIFASIIQGGYLLPMLLVSRGINFYFLFLVAMALSMAEIVKQKKE